MSRKYRHSGYQDRDDDRERRERPRGEQRGGPRQDLTKEERIHKKGLRHALDRDANEVVRCYNCGRNVEMIDAMAPDSRCPGCSIDLHCCRVCKFFDTGARFQCREELDAAIENKTRANDCTKFRPRLQLDVTGRRQKKNAPKTARSAFDDLFKN